MVLEIKNISKSYGKLKVLKEVSFDLKRGEYAAIIGKNGVGKTTLLNILIGFILPDNGLVKYFGKSFTDNMTSILYKIGIVLQQHTLDFDLSVNKNYYQL